MTTLDSLRKEYDKLDPFERAVMDAEALERQDGAAIDALLPPTLWDAFHGMGSKLAFALLSFIAVHESQRGENLYWMGMAISLVLRHELEWDQKEADPELDEKIDGWIDGMHDGQRRARAWLMALEAIDKETGGACMSYAHVFAGSYVDCIMSREAKKETDCSAEFEHLRQMWNALATNSPCMPKVQEVARQ